MTAQTTNVKAQGRKVRSSTPFRALSRSGLAARGVQFRSLSESINTTTPTSKLTFHIIGALAEFERALALIRRLGDPENQGPCCGARRQATAQIDNARFGLAR